MNCLVHVANMAIFEGADVDVVDCQKKLVFEGSDDVLAFAPMSEIFGVVAYDGAGVCSIGFGRDGDNMVLGWVL